MSDTNLEVAVIMGSDSDLPVVEAAFPIFDKFGINYTKNVMSAHRTPHDVIEFIKNSENNGVNEIGNPIKITKIITASIIKPIIGLESPGRAFISSVNHSPPGVISGINTAMINHTKAIK